MRALDSSTLPVGVVSVAEILSSSPSCGALSHSGSRRMTYCERTESNRRATSVLTTSGTSKIWCAGSPVDAVITMRVRRFVETEEKAPKAGEREGERAAKKDH